MKVLEREHEEAGLVAPARSRATIAASCRLRSSSGTNFGPRSAGSGISSSGARRIAVSCTSSFTWASVVSRSASRLSAATSWPPKRARPHSATGCSGVFCRSWDEFRFDPSLRRLTEPGVELLDEPGLSQPRLADDLDELAFAGTDAVPATEQRPDVLFVPDEGRESPRATSSTAAAGANDSIK